MRSWLVGVVASASLIATAPCEARGRYPASNPHAPMTADVVAHAREVFARGHHRADVFSKIGDSITASGHFLTCFASPTEVDLAGRDKLEGALAFFSRERADDAHESWNRLSKSAFVGWSTFGALGTKMHSPVHEELRATDAAFAVVMYGTNETYGGGVPNYEKNLRRLIHEILADDVVPLVSTFPPRRDSPPLDGVAREMNAVARDVALSENVPLMDLESVLLELPGYGLGPDGIHPRASESRPCSFTREALENGMNARNLLVLEALDRAKRFVVDGEAPETE